MQMFNRMKLPVYVPLFQKKKVAILGAGAVGSFLAEILARMGVGQILCVDMDTFEADNLSKSAGMIDPDKDIGRPKALAVAEQTARRMIPGGICRGIHTDLCRLGPMAFADWDGVFLALDNYAAKELVNRLLMQLPQNRRPVMGIAGTSGESAVAVLLDGKEFCLRCLFDESWLEAAQVRTGCGGPQYMQLEEGKTRIRTSGLASQLAAALLAEKFRAWVLGDARVMNTRTTYTAYPHLELLDTQPMAKKDCPDCGGIRPPEQVLPLSGSVMELTLAQTLGQITDRLGHRDFRLKVHLMGFREQSYGGFITGEFCHHCGRPVTVYAHESRVGYDQVLCPACQAAGKLAYYDPDRPVGQSLRSFPAACSDKRLLESTLFDLGYPLGAYLYVVAGDSRYCFTCTDDPRWLETMERM